MLDVETLTHVTGTVFATGHDALKLSVRQQLDNGGGSIATSGTLDIRTKALVNRGGKIKIIGADGAKVVVAEALDNSAGEIIAAGNVDLKVSDLINQGGRVVADDTSTLNAVITGTLDNSAQGNLAAGGAMTIEAATLDNQSECIQHAGKGRLSVAADALNGQSGTIASNGAATFTANIADLSGATIYAENLDIEASMLTHVGGKLATTCTGASRGKALDRLDNTGGKVLSKGGLDLQAKDLDNNRGMLMSEGDTTIKATSSIVNSEGHIEYASQGQLTLKADTLQGQAETIASNGSLALTAKHVDLDRAITQAKKIDLDAGRLSHVNGKFLATGTDKLVVHAREGLDNTGGSIVDNGALELHAQALTNQRGEINAAGPGATTIVVKETIDNSAGKLLMAGDMTCFSLDLIWQTCHLSNALES